MKHKQAWILKHIASIVFRNARPLYPGEEAPIEAYFAKKRKKIPKPNDEILLKQ